jgi:hypothetical protein
VVLGLLLRVVADDYSNTSAAAHGALFLAVGVTLVGCGVHVVRLFRQPIRPHGGQTRLGGLVLLGYPSALVLKAASEEIQLVILGAFAAFLFGFAVWLICLFTRVTSEEAAQWASERQRG